jgi:opacity protein-like surface antigen
MRYPGSLIAASAFLFATGAVHAQDLNDWSGLYLGLHGGARWGPSNISPQSFTSRHVSGTSTAGLQAGYDRTFGDWENGHFLLGAEGDFNIGKLSTYQTRPTVIAAEQNLCFAIPCGPPPYFGGSDQSAVLADTSARVRVGITWQQWLLYLAGGGSLAHVRLHETATFQDDNPARAARHCAATDPVCSLSGADDAIVTGWTLGFGGEMKLSQNIGIAIEYRHSDFGQNTFNLVPTYTGTNFFSFGNFLLPASNRLTGDMTTLRVNYRFTE